MARAEWFVRKDTQGGAYYWTRHGYWTQDIMLAKRMSKRDAEATVKLVNRDGHNARAVN